MRPVGIRKQNHPIKLRKIVLKILKRAILKNHKMRTSLKCMKLSIKNNKILALSQDKCQILSIRTIPKELQTSLKKESIHKTLNNSLSSITFNPTNKNKNPEISHSLINPALPQQKSQIQAKPITAYQI